MFDFYSEVKKMNNSRKTLTENGAVAYATSGHALLDMNFKVSSYRNMSETQILNDFVKAYAETPELAIKWMFYVGDIREGLGERRLFRILLKYVISQYKHLIQYIGEYNRFDSLFELFDTDAEKDMIEFVKKQLKEDLVAANNNKSCSLLAKWMPSANTSSKSTVAKAHKLMTALGMRPVQYRKMLSKLRKHINIVEAQMCAQKWTDINYEQVPSKANILYKNAFLKHDEARRREFLGKLSSGEVKINAGAVFPHDIIHKYTSDQGSRWDCRAARKDETLEGMWKALPNTVDPTKPVIVVRDGSGSMSTTISGTKITALEVATALTIYFSERTNKAFANKFITFSSRSELIDMTNCKSLFDKINLCAAHDDCSNTNVKAVFDQILNIAVRNHVEQSEIPTILIVSDMEFDSATGRTANQTLFGRIASDYAQHGYKLPKLVFWNVMNRSGAIPVQQNKLGVALISGFSQNTCKMIMSNKLDPFEALKDVLLSKRYEVIK